jgi:hypothetical protein
VSDQRVRGRFHHIQPAHQLAALDPVVAVIGTFSQKDGHNPGLNEVEQAISFGWIRDGAPGRKQCAPDLWRKEIGATCHKARSLKRPATDLTVIVQSFRFVLGSKPNQTVEGL